LTQANSIHFAIPASLAESVLKLWQKRRSLISVSSKALNKSDNKHCLLCLGYILERSIYLGLLLLHRKEHRSILMRSPSALS